MADVKTINQVLAKKEPKSTKSVDMEDKRKKSNKSKTVKIVSDQDVEANPLDVEPTAKASGGEPKAPKAPKSTKRKRETNDEDDPVASGPSLGDLKKMKRGEQSPLAAKTKKAKTTRRKNVVVALDKETNIVHGENGVSFGERFKLEVNNYYTVTVPNAKSAFFRAIPVHHPAYITTISVQGEDLIFTLYVRETIIGDIGDMIALY